MLSGTRHHQSCLSSSTRSFQGRHFRAWHGLCAPALLRFQGTDSRGMPRHLPPTQRFVATVFCCAAWEGARKSLQARICPSNTPRPILGVLALCWGSLLEGAARGGGCHPGPSTVPSSAWQTPDLWPLCHWGQLRAGCGVTARRGSHVCRVFLTPL